MQGASIRKIAFWKQLRRHHFDSVFSSIRNQIPLPKDPVEAVLIHLTKQQQLITYLEASVNNWSNNDQQSLVLSLQRCSNIFMHFQNKKPFLNKNQKQTYLSWLFTLLNEQWHNDAVLSIASALLTELVRIFGTCSEMNICELIGEKINLDLLKSGRYPCAINTMLTIGNALLSSSNSRLAYVLMVKRKLFCSLISINNNVKQAEQKDAILWLTTIVIFFANRFRYFIYFTSQYQQCKKLLSLRISEEIINHQNAKSDTLCYLQVLVIQKISFPWSMIHFLQLQALKLLTRQKKQQQRKKCTKIIEILIRILFNQNLYCLEQWQGFSKELFCNNYNKETTQLLLILISNHIINKKSDEIVYFFKNGSLVNLWKKIKDFDDQIAKRQILKLMHNISLIQDSFQIFTNVAPQLMQQQQINDLIEKLGFKA